MQMPLSKARELLMLLRAYSNEKVLKEFRGVHINLQMLEVIRRYGSSLDISVKEERVSKLSYEMNPAQMIKIMSGD